MLAESILAAVPHRPFTFTIPKMLRPYFRFHRGLLKQLCRIALQCVSDFQRDAFGDANGVGTTVHDGVPAIVMAIHTFGEYLDFCHRWWQKDLWLRTLYASGRGRGE